MALVVKDRVKVTTATTGTGTLTLGSAVAGFQAFSAVLSNADTTYYAIFESSTGAFEVGLGTYASPANTLARTTVLESSNAGSAINLTAGDADVFITYAAEKSVYLDGAGSVTSAAGQIDISDFNNDAGYSTTTGTVTSVAGTAGTGISVSGSPITTSGTLTITNTAPHIATNLTYSTASTTGTVNSSTGTNATLPAATTTLAGLLTGADKTKLNGIATGAQVNVATNLGYTTAASTGAVTSSTGTNATLPAATTTLAGLLTGADKTKLNGIATGATANTGTVTSVAASAGTGISISGSPITTSGTLTITNTAPHIATNLGYTTAATTGTVTSSTGTNATIPAATTSLAGLLTGADKTKLNGIAAGAQVNVATNLGYTTAASTGTVTSSTGTNATLPAATTTLAGLLTGADKTKLNGIATGAQVNVATNLGITNGTTAGPIITSSTGTNATFPTASATISGAVTTGAQTFSGVKTFSGPLTVSSTNTGSNYLAIQRITSANEEVRHFLGDLDYNIQYTNDENTSSIVLRLINTDTETGGGVGASNHAVTFKAIQSGVSLTLPGTSTITASTFTGNAATATTLQTARTINGVSFNGSANITVADATKMPLTGGTFTGNVNYGNFSITDVENITVDNQIISTGDTNTFMQFHAADQWRVVTGNVERIEASNAGIRINNAYTLPTADGTNGQALVTNGSGTLTFASAGISTGKAIAMAIVFG